MLYLANFPIRLLSFIPETTHWGEEKKFHSFWKICNNYPKTNWFPLSLFEMLCDKEQYVNLVYPWNAKDGSKMQNINRSLIFSGRVNYSKLNGVIRRLEPLLLCDNANFQRLVFAFFETKICSKKRLSWRMIDQHQLSDSATCWAIICLHSKFCSCDNSLRCAASHLQSWF